MSEAYIRAHYQDIKRLTDDVETRLDDAGCTLESRLHDNAETLQLCRAHAVRYRLIDGSYPPDLDI